MFSSAIKFILRSTESDVWDEDECNEYVGTDSTIIPGFMSEDEGAFSIFSSRMNFSKN